MACSTAPYCLGVWTDARCTPCAVTTLSATPKPAQHCLQHPRPFFYRAAWCWAVSPGVALPWRPWHGERHWAAWACAAASNAALLQFLLSGLLPLSRSTTSKIVVAPMARAGLSPRVALPTGPWPVLRHRTAWACGEMPDAPCVLSRPSLLPPSPRSTACNTQDACASCRGARPSALGLRCHGARGMVNGVGLLGHAEGHLTQPCCSFYPLACSHYRALLPRRPSWRRWPGQA